MSYLQTITAILALLTPALDQAADRQAGEDLFNAVCKSCHGENGDGNGPLATEFVLKPRAFSLAAFKFDTDADWERGTDADLTNVIRNGTGTYGGSAAMPPWGHLSDTDIDNLIEYIRSLKNQASIH